MTKNQIIKSLKKRYCKNKVKFVAKINDAAAGYSSSEDITVKFDLSKDTLIIEI